MSSPSSLHFVGCRNGISLNLGDRQVFGMSYGNIWKILLVNWYGQGFGS